jgi:ABC-2 type transport system permease protein
MRFWLMLKKEFLVIFRDIHALLALFIMPVIFILIMSLATKDLFITGSKPIAEIFVIDKSDSNISKTLIEKLQKISYIKVSILDKDESKSDLKQKLFSKENGVVLYIDTNLSNCLRSKDTLSALRLELNPSMKKEWEILAIVAVESGVKTLEFEQMMKKAMPKSKNEVEANKTELSKTYIYKDNKKSLIPSAVQQSVPAWLVFSMFFIVIAISNSFIAERMQGTLLRIKTMNVSKLQLIGSKFIPYFLINQVQVVAMIAVGIYIVPLLGGDRFELAGDIAALILLSSAVSFAAISFAFFVASVSKTTEESTTIGGVSNIIFGALGGVMVPKFVMPEVMQKIADLSPMSWALDGFLDLFVNGAGISDIFSNIGALLLFGSVCLCIAVVVLKYQKMEAV